MGKLLEGDPLTLSGFGAQEVIFNISDFCVNVQNDSFEIISQD